MPPSSPRARSESSRRGVHKADEAGRLMRADEQLFEHAHAAMDAAAVGQFGGHERLNVHRQRIAPAAVGFGQAVMRDGQLGAVVETMAPERMRVAEAAHRKDRTRRRQRKPPLAAQAGRHRRNPPRSRLPFDVKAGGVEMPLGPRSEEHTSELQSLMRNSYAVFCLKK